MKDVARFHSLGYCPAMFYDTHAHLDSPEIQPGSAGCHRSCGRGGHIEDHLHRDGLESSARAVEFSDRFSSVYAAVGWHPSDAALAPEDVRPGLRNLAQHPKVVALGEMGLDYHRLPSKQEGGALA